MRGKAICCGAVRLPVGITPAYAGKREKARWKKMKLKGSPPHMRGKEFLNLESLPQLGITPAYAGKSHTADFRVVLWWDHPRICGEKLQKLII